MASTASESSEICTPTGSVLITQTSGGNAAPFQFFTGFSQIESGFTEPFQHDKDDAKLPTASPPQRGDSDDWIHWDTVDPAVLRLTLDESDSLEFQTPDIRPESQKFLGEGEVIGERAVSEPTQTPFHKWMRTLRRRAGRRQCSNTIDEMLFRSVSVDNLHGTANNGAHHHRQSSSGSSFGFVEAVKTASVSLASGSVFARSRRNSMRSSRTQTHTDRSSRASMSSNRCSEDSVGLDKPQLMDKAAVERSLQRRRILEELISTEEGYIGDVRFLMNVSCCLRVAIS